MKVYYDTTCNFCKASIKPFTNNKNVELCKAKSKKTIIVEHNGKVYRKSDAVIELLKTKSKVFVILKIIPRFIRDLVYNVIAKNRYIFN